MGNLEPATKRGFPQQKIELATKTKFRQRKFLFRQQNQSNRQQNGNFRNKK
ncbi:hypothetical protein [Bacillus sp. CECT 9360]|uniref:hypothetical protein n=1 Tax=Bacillus sp. CECT 9360 TaxID=2845821 RepID=UPI001E5BD3D1|nr:hypothetical protein [Bacillus sp. CECT 9360]